MSNANWQMYIDGLFTIRDMIRWGVSQFNAANIYSGHGIANTWDEAVYLTLTALHLPPMIDDRILEARLLPEERKVVIELLLRRINERKPAAYLTQEAWFAGLPFYVDERVIIPRSPMAELIEQNFEPWLESGAIHHVLDLCTGSGCIAIACALALPEANVDAVDISKDALAVAEKNVKRHHVPDQVELIQSDLFNQLAGRSYDLIISNPPYVSHDEMAALPAEYHHEPRLALAAGENGLSIVEQILAEAKQYLSPNGVLIVEVGNSAQALIDLFPEIPFTWLEFERGGQGVFLLTADQLKTE